MVEHSKKQAGRLVGDHYLKMVFLFLLPLGFFSMIFLMEAAVRSVLHVPPYRQQAISFSPVSVALTVICTAVMILGWKIMKWCIFRALIFMNKTSPRFALFDLFSARWIIKYVRVRLNLFFHKLGWFLLCFAPYGAAKAVCAYLEQMNRGYVPFEFYRSFLELACILLFAVSLTLYFCVCARYFLAPYFFLKGVVPDTRCIRKSVAHMRGKISLVISYYISYLPWNILSLLILPALFIFPFFYMSRICLSKNILSQFGTEEETVQIGILENA